LRTRCGEARGADVTDVVALEKRAAPVRPLTEALCIFVTSLVVFAGIERGNRLDRAQGRPVTSSATASLIRRSQPVMHRRVALARCSATGSNLRGLARRVGPSLELAAQRSWGSSRPSQVCSRSG
jgi:hypothetical protein